MKTSQFSKYIVEGLLGEESKKNIAVYAGSFRPPTKSDYNLLLKAIEENPGLDQIHVFVGDSESEGLNQDDSVEIFKMFGEHFPRDFYVHKSEESPVSDVYAYASKFPTYDISWLFGVRSGNSDDFKEVADRTKSVNTYDNLSIRPIVYDDKTTEREVAAAANMGKDELAKYMPNKLTYKELDTIYNMLNKKQLNEGHFEFTYDILNKIVDGGYEWEDWDRHRTDDMQNRLMSLSQFRKKNLVTAQMSVHERLLVIFASNELTKPTDESNIELKSWVDVVQNATEQDLQDIQDAASINLSEQLKEEIYDNTSKILDKITEEGWEHVETNGNLPRKAAIVKDLAGRRKKKLYTVGFEQDTTMVPPIQMVNVFWSNQGDGPKRDIIEGGTKQDAQDIIDAGELNLMEVEDKDLVGFEDVINKIAEEEWEYVDLSNFRAKEFLLKKISKEKNKKIFTTDFDPSGALGIFWADKGVLKDSDNFLRVTKQDAQDIIDAGEFNLMEVADIDLKKFGQLLDKIAEEEYKYIPSDELLDNGLIRPNLIEKATELDSNVFTITKNISGGGPFGDQEKQTSLSILMATPKAEPIKQYYIHNTTDQDLEDILDAGSLNEVEDSDLNNFSKLLDKIVDKEVNFYGMLSPRFHGSKVVDFLKGEEARVNQPQFAIQKFQNGLVVLFSDGERFPLSDSSDQDLQDIKDAASLNEAENIPRFTKLLDKIVEGEYYYKKTKSNNIRQLKNAIYTIKNVLKFDKPFFVSTDRDEAFNDDFAVMFSDDTENIFWIIDMTDQDYKDFDQTIQMFTKDLESAIKSRVNEAVEFEYDPVHGLDHYEDLMSYMSSNGLNIDPKPKIKFIDDDEENAADLFGKTAYYNPNDYSVVLYTFGRHPKDILRSFAHELVHVHQDNEGRLGNVQTTNTNEDSHLEDLEREAYETGNIMFRQWTDSIKEGKKKDYGISAYAAELARLRENIDKKSQKKHKGKSAPYGSAYEPVKEEAEIKAVEVKVNPFKVYCDLNDTITDGSEFPQWTEQGKMLWEYIKPYDVTILSNTSNVNNKIKFIKANLPERNHYEFVDKNKKWEYATPTAILIDNRVKTIDAWNEAGGIGILFTNINKVITELMKLGL